jgi:hypothetical protein
VRDRLLFSILRACDVLRLDIRIGSTIQMHWLAQVAP